MADNKYYFEKLTPTDRIDLGVYEDAINYVFENDHVKNVAVSGAYSAGKSGFCLSRNASARFKRKGGFTCRETFI